MPKTALVLEGGSLRGIFTAGILDRMLQKQIRFDYVIGTSAGALNAMNYISGQIGRTARIDMTYVNDKRFIGMRQLISRHSIFNFKFLFGEISHELMPFDYKTFYENPAVFDIVTTSMITGQPVYFRKGECNVDLAVQASSSLPLLSQPVYIDDDLYMDGGCSMPIAYKRALDLGYDRIVVILTRDKEYQKHPVSSAKRKVY
ncbi:MAG: patatin family protein, partial [Erysipelotrichaceae bacterium]|nr:patatin family protein [Erysipelotrichaceae bacterium]